MKPVPEFPVHLLRMGPAPAPDLPAPPLEARPLDVAEHQYLTDTELLLQYIEAAPEPCKDVRERLAQGEECGAFMKRCFDWALTPQGLGAVASSSKEDASFDKPLRDAQQAYVTLQSDQAQHHVWSSGSKGGGRSPARENALRVDLQTFRYRLRKMGLRS